MVLCKHSEYFDTCLNSEFSEARKGIIQFDDIDPKYLALYIGVCYTYSTLVTPAAPAFATNPELSAPATPMKDYVEVYKLCDRFLSSSIAVDIVKSIEKCIGDGHRALFRSAHDRSLQKRLMRDFADGYEALNLEHAKQSDMAKTLITYFSDGVDYMAWVEDSEELKYRPRFVAEVSRAFAAKLQILKPRKRKELLGPS